MILLTTFMIVAQQEKDLRADSQVVADERIASNLQRKEDEATRSFKRDYEMARKLEVNVSFTFHFSFHFSFFCCFSSISLV